MWEIGVWLGMAVAVVGITHWAYRWGNPKCSGQLPPGSMGFPFIGETIEFVKQCKRGDIIPFTNERISRFGPLFRTSLFGLKVVVSTDPEVNFEIMRRENIFVFDYPDSLRRIAGKENLFFEGGDTHRYVRNLTLQFFGSESLKRRLIQETNDATHKHLQRAAIHGFIEVKELAAAMISECISKKITSDMEPEAARVLDEKWKCLHGGWFQFPFSIPGTTLHKSLQARKEVVKMIKEIFHKKRELKEPCHTDSFLDTFLEEIEKEDSILNEGRAVDLIFIFLLVSQETTSTVIKSAVKLLSDHPQVLEELKKEHQRLLQNRICEKLGITWEEYKSLTFTHMVINESLRLSASSTFMFRKASQDVDIGGYTIPAGWFVLLVPSVHFDPKTYKDPYAFNPWRWEGIELHAGSKTFMAFGGGGRMCAGSQFAKLQIAIFLHHLVTKFRWSLDPHFPEGTYIQISEYPN